MNNVESYYEYANEQGVFVCNETRISHKSCCVGYGGLGAIALNLNLIENSTDELCCLAHELGHWKTGTFYRTTSPYEVRGKAENIANTWAVFSLVPINELIDALSDGCRSRWELAEALGVTEQMVEIAFDVYHRKQML